MHSTIYMHLALHGEAVFYKAQADALPGSCIQLCCYALALVRLWGDFLPAGRGVDDLRIVVRQLILRGRCILDDDKSGNKLLVTSCSFMTIMMSIDRRNT